MSRRQTLAFFSDVKKGFHALGRKGQSVGIPQSPRYMSAHTECHVPDFPQVHFCLLYMEENGFKHYLTGVSAQR